ncbi:MAG: YciI family protein [Polyangiaceae bacterium]
MQYHLLVYFDPKVVFNGSPEANAVLAETEPHNAEMKANGTMLMGVPLNLPQEAITVQVRDGKMSTTDGPFMETKEMLGGLILIEARDLNDAIRIASGIPHARLGHIEIRPVIDFSKPRPKL